MPSVSETFRRLARQFAGDPVDFEGAVGQVEFAERDRGTAEGVGLHHVGAGLEIAAVQFAHQVGTGQAEHVGAVLAAPVVALDVERQGLHASAHAAVAQQHAVTQRIEQMGAGGHQSAAIKVGASCIASGGVSG